MQKVLVLAFFFPPIAASGSLRPAGIVRHLPEHGFKPIVLAADPAAVYPPVAVDDSLEVLQRDGLQVHRLAYRNTLEALLQFRAKLKAAIPSHQAVSSGASTQLAGTKDTDVGLKDLLLDRAFIFPDHQKYWKKPVRQWVRGLNPADGPDVVLATANPWSSLELGVTISQSLKIPLVADFRDPWFRNPKPQPNARLLPAVRRREAAVIRHADRVIANTSTLAETFRNDYPEAASKIVTVTNGFARELMPRREQTSSHSTIELCHFGTVYPLRNPKTLLQALKVLSDQNGELAITLRLVGGWDVQDSETDLLAEELERTGLLIREGSVPRTVALQKMAEASHLLVLQQDFPLQIPAKLYEYIATARPIVAIGGPGATRDLINEYKLGTCCADDVHEIENLLRRLLSEPDYIPAPTDETIEHFEYRQISAQVANVLRDAI